MYESIPPRCLRPGPPGAASHTAHIPSSTTRRTSKKKTSRRTRPSPPKQSRLEESEEWSFEIEVKVYKLPILILLQSADLEAAYTGRNGKRIAGHDVSFLQRAPVVGNHPTPAIPTPATVKGFLPRRDSVGAAFLSRRLATAANRIILAEGGRPPSAALPR